ncbi:MAG: PDZ domain-containing protein [Pyrinomonadaceae bacterium]|nr:PDZ domain-containing protein [Pyrinomonadaceae bacterium]
MQDILETINAKVLTFVVCLTFLCGAGDISTAASAQTHERNNTIKPKDTKPVSAPPSANVEPAPAVAPNAVSELPVAVAPPQAPRSPSKRRGMITPATVSALQVSSPPAPPGVITVVHRLSGWKLLAWLAATRSPVVEVDDLPFASDVHTNIVAGFVSEDGRTVIARLGQAEAEGETSVAPPLEPGATGSLFDLPELTVVQRDGQQIKARFIGLDGSTGLSLLETAAPVFAPAPKVGVVRMSVGQRVRLFAPEPVHPPRAASPNGKVFFSISESGGKLSKIKITPSGRAVGASLRAPVLTSAWTGAIATDEAGTIIGIVAESNDKETQLVTAEGMRAAEKRVRARRASVPQPWLGARGDAIATVKLDHLIARGWSRDNARTLIDRGQGVLLSRVAPGTPAALAGLRSGDIVARISEHEIKNLDDLSLSLKEAGSGATIDFTVLRRSLETATLKLPVTLSESLNPAFATGEAELRAVEDELRSLEKEIRAMKPKVSESEAGALEALMKAKAEEEVARRAGDQARVVAAIKSLLQSQRLLESSRKEFERFNNRYREIYERHAQAQRRGGTPLAFRYNWNFNKRPFIEGLKTIAISPKIAARFRAQNGLLVTAIMPQTPAAMSGLRPGDVIEGINGQSFPEAEWKFEFRFGTDVELDFNVVREGKKFKLKFSQPDGVSTEKK